MSASELPYEILSKIADLLLTGDRFSCVLTCRRWRYPFQEALWRNMHVNSMKNLETICNAIEGSRTKSSSYGLLTQSLRMDGYCTIPHWQQHAFFRSIPNLRHLDLGRTRYQEMNTHMIRLNNTWKSLESLRVEVHGSKRAVDTKSFVERQLFFFPIQMYSNIWKHSSFLLQPCHNGPILFSGNFFVHYKFLSSI
ncbi:hypothetical protein F4703DRAFT_1582329 [Phycomyces blakesleeanus]